MGKNFHFLATEGPSAGESAPLLLERDPLLLDLDLDLDLLPSCPPLLDWVDSVPLGVSGGFP